MQTVELFQTDYGAVILTPTMLRRVATVRRRKDGDLDYRFAAARRLKTTLVKLMLRQYLRT